jgi:DNA-binding NtrC family response regulator
LTAESLELLMLQPWPGNVRELRNVLEQATLMTDDPQLTPAHFGPALQLAPTPVAAPARREAAPVLPSVNIQPLPEQVAALERSSMAAALLATGGNRVAAARALGISRAAFYDKLSRWPELTLVGR